MVAPIRFIPVCIAFLTAIACASSSSQWDRKTPEGLYGAANEEFEDGYYPEAIALFERLLAQHPYSAEARLGRLRLADVSFEKRMHDDAINRYSNFIGYHPNHPKVPYARLMIAESHAERIPSESIFLPPPEEKIFNVPAMHFSSTARWYRSIQRVTKLKRHAMAFSACEGSWANTNSMLRNSTSNVTSSKQLSIERMGSARPTQDSDSTSKHSELRRKVMMLWETMTKRSSSTRSF